MLLTREHQLCPEIFDGRPGCLPRSRAPALRPAAQLLRSARDLQHVLHLCALAQDTWAEATKLRRGKRYTVCNAVRTPAGQARRLSGCDWSRNSYGRVPSCGSSLTLARGHNCGSLDDQSSKIGKM